MMQSPAAPARSRDSFSRIMELAADLSRLSRVADISLRRGCPRILRWGVIFRADPRSAFPARVPERATSRRWRAG
jgi:hypothetical protein